MNYLLRISRYLHQAIDFLGDLRTELLNIRKNQQEIISLLQSTLQNSGPERMLRPNEVALELKVTEKTIYNWKKSGKLVPVTIGSFDYYPESHIRGIKPF